MNRVLFATKDGNTPFGNHAFGVNSDGKYDKIKVITNLRAVDI
jgi:hypothetical protein